MELKLDDVKATLIRLQGQIDVWNGLYQELLKQEAKQNESAKNNEAVGA